MPTVNIRAVLDPMPRARPVALRHGRDHLREDLALVRAGVLDPRGFLSGYIRHLNPVELRTNSLLEDTVEVDPRLLVRDPGGQVLRDPDWGNLRRVWTGIRRQHNLRTTMGRDQWQRLVMAGNVAANSTFATAAGAATATSATSLTNSGAAFPTTGGPNGSLQGQVVVCSVAGVYGVIGAGNTATNLPVDQWTDITSATGAAGATPAATAAYVVMPMAALASWIGLSTHTAAVAAGDVLRTADGLFADGTTGAASTELTANAMGRQFARPTFPGAGQYQYAVTWTATGTPGNTTIHKVIMCNSKPFAGSLLFLETVLSADAFVSALGDQVQLTWLVTL